MTDVVLLKENKPFYIEVGAVYGSDGKPSSNQTTYSKSTTAPHATAGLTTDILVKPIGHIQDEDTEADNGQKVETPVVQNGITADRLAQLIGDVQRRGIEPNSNRPDLAYLINSVQAQEVRANFKRTSLAELIERVY